MFDTTAAEGGVVLEAATLRQWRDLAAAAAAAGPGLGAAGRTDAERIDVLRAAEELKNVLAGVQAVTAAGFEVSQRAGQAAAGVGADRRGRGIAGQVALARRESPHRGQGHLGLARMLVMEMPHILAALISGRITEWRATMIVRDTAWLSAEHRAVVDEVLAGTPEAAAQLESWSDGRVRGELLRLAQQLDVEALVKRRRRAVRERRVTGRPAPDTMMYLTALLPVRDGVAVIAALTRDAKAAIAADDPRTRDQIMADLLVGRVTGRDPADGSSSVTIDLVITDAALFDGSLFGNGHPSSTGTGSTAATEARAGSPAAAAAEAAEATEATEATEDDETGTETAHAEAHSTAGTTPGTTGPGTTGPGNTANTASAVAAANGAAMGEAADDPAGGDDEAAAALAAGRMAAAGSTESAYLHGYGPVPAELAREIAAQALDPAAAPVLLRRLYAHPRTGALVAMESRARLFPPALARYIRLRDRVCRTPWCDAPVRQIDHVVGHADGGPTSATNGQGLCTACNLAKQAPGWDARPAPPQQPGGPHTVIITTPTGHTYTSHAPPPASQPGLAVRLGSGRPGVD